MIDGLADLEAKMTFQNLPRWTASVIREDEVQVHLPKFKTTSQFDVHGFYQFHEAVCAVAPARVGNMPELMVFPGRYQAHARIQLFDALRLFGETYPDYRVLRAIIGERVIFEYAANAGMGVVEMMRQSGGYENYKAVNELCYLYEQVFGEEFMDVMKDGGNG